MFVYHLYTQQFLYNFPFILLKETSPQNFKFQFINIEIKIPAIKILYLKNELQLRKSHNKTNKRKRLEYKMLVYKIISGGYTKKKRKKEIKNK